MFISIFVVNQVKFNNPSLITLELLYAITYYRLAETQPRVHKL